MPCSLQAVIDACKAIAGHPGVLRFQDFVINTDVIVLSTPEIAGLPYVISGLVAAGGLAAALSTADGLLLAIANALSHDIYYKMLDPNAPTIRRLTVARVLLFFVAVASAALAASTGRRTSWPWWAGRSRSPWPAISRRWCSASGGNAPPRPARSAGSLPAGASACSISWSRGISRRRA